MGTLTTLTRKGQVTIPTEVRDELGLKPFDKIEVTGDGGSVAETADQDALGRRSVGDRARPVGGHEDHVFARDHLRGVLVGERAVVVAFYARGVLLAPAQ